MASVLGSALDDTLLGGPDGDTLRGFGGNDLLMGNIAADQLLGGAGNDTLDGGMGPDTLRAGNGDDTLIFNAADRTNGAGWDVYDGGKGGHDTLHLSFTAAEWANAEVRAQVMAFLDKLAAASGGSVNYKFSSLNLRATNIEAAAIYIDGQLWTPGPQVIDLSGSTADETVVISGTAGSVVTTGIGNDTITGGPGNDTISSGAGADYITIGDGDDVVFAGSGNDTIVAGLAGGNDFIDGGTGNDTVCYPSLAAGEPVMIDLNLADRSADPAAVALLVANGLAANTPVGLANGGVWVDTDVLISIENAIGGAGADTIIGDGVANLLDGLDGTDTITGGAGDDTLYGRAGDDNLNGGLDDDTIAGGTGDDRIDGGGGYDTLVLAGNSTDYNVQVLGNGLYSVTDNGASGDGVDVISQIENITFADVTVGLWSLVGPIVVNGTNGNDTLSGTAASERFYGLDGDDLITGGQEEDAFIGGAGNDTLDGGGPLDPGNQDDLNFLWDSLNYDDEYRQAVNAGVAAQGVVVNLTTGIATDTYGDTDTVIEIERVLGTPLGDLLIGSAGNDAFDPHGGADTIDGGAGTRDSLHYHLTDGYYGGGTTGITVQFSATVAGDGTAIDPLGDTDVFSGIERVRGTRYDDSFTAGAGFQQFRGYDGSDTFDGSGGLGYTVVQYWDDASYGGNAGISFDLSVVDAQGWASVIDGFGQADRLRGIDEIVGTGAADDMRGDTNDNLFIGDAGDDYLSGGDGFDNLFADLGDDTLDGGADDDWLEGAAGADMLTGGTGNDTLTGGFDSDQFVFAAGSGADRIDDFEVGLDHLVLLAGITVTGLTESDVNGDGGLDTTVDLSSGDSIVLLHVAGVTDPLQLF